MSILEDYINDTTYEPIHMWGEEFDWDGLSDAIDIIWKHCKKAHICADVKEKYGAIRFYPISYYNGTLKSWFCPGIRCNISVNKFIENKIIYKKDSGIVFYPIKRNIILNKIFIKPINWILKYVSSIDRFIANHFIPNSLIEKVNDYQWGIINDGFQKACLKYPHLVNEICAYVDCYKVIKPNNIGPVDGEVIFNKYWKEI